MTVLLHAAALSQKFFYYMSSEHGQGKSEANPLYDDNACHWFWYIFEWCWLNNTQRLHSMFKRLEYGKRHGNKRGIFICRAFVCYRAPSRVPHFSTVKLLYPLL